jgi:hypothetical protein
VQQAKSVQVFPDKSKMNSAPLKCLFCLEATGMFAIQKVVLTDRFSAEKLCTAAARTGHQLVTHRLLDAAATPAGTAANEVLMTPVIASGRHVVVAATPLALHFSFADIPPGGMIFSRVLAFFFIAVDPDPARPGLNSRERLLATGTEHLSGCIPRYLFHINTSSSSG